MAKRGQKLPTLTTDPTMAIVFELIALAMALTETARVFVSSSTMRAYSRIKLNELWQASLHT